MLFTSMFFIFTHPVWAENTCAGLFSERSSPQIYELSLTSILERLELNEKHGTLWPKKDNPNPSIIHRAFLEVPFYAKQEVLDAFLVLSPSELRLLANNISVVEKLIAEARNYSGVLSQQLNKFQLDLSSPGAAKAVQLSAKLLYLRVESPNLVSFQGTITTQEFLRQAKIAGLPVKTFAEVFRFDSRSPEQIRQATGFLSNPRQKIGTVLEHTLKSSTGSGFISTTVKPGNTNILISSGVITAKAAEVNQTLSKQERLELAKATGASPEKMRDSERWSYKRIYEYRIANIQGALPFERLSIAEEAEVVTASIPVSNITHYREVIVVTGEILGGQERIGAVFSDWKSL